MTGKEAQHEATRYVLVTGATSGIGEACVHALLDDSSDTHVLGVGRSREKLDEVRARHGERFSPIPIDLSSEGSALVVASACHRVTGGVLHGLVNGAGIISSGSIEETSREELEHMLGINLIAPFELVRELLPQLRVARQREQHASVVNISSVSGLRPYPNLSAYCISKAALDQMTRCMAIELAPEQITVNAVNPGVVVSALHRRGGMSEEQYAAFLERGAQTHPTGRVGNAEEIASLILYLLSGQAGWVTGETISIDGGRHLTSAR